jgi:hypothetical protein
MVAVGGVCVVSAGAEQLADTVIVSARALSPLSRACIRMYVHSPAFAQLACTPCDGGGGDVEGN